MAAEERAGGRRGARLSGSVLPWGTPRTWGGGRGVRTWQQWALKAVKYKREQEKKSLQKLSVFSSFTRRRVTAVLSLAYPPSLPMLIKKDENWARIHHTSLLLQVASWPPDRAF